MKKKLIMACLPSTSSFRSSSPQSILTYSMPIVLSPRASMP